MWNILEGLSGVTERGGEVRVGMVTGRGGGREVGGLEGDETRSSASASLPRQLISASCWRLAERKYTPGGLASESCCSTSTEISDQSIEFISCCPDLLVLLFLLVHQ